MTHTAAPSLPWPVMNPHVAAVHARADHFVSKEPRDRIHLITGVGVEGDAHAGATVQHRSRVGRGKTLPNLRQVHLIASELFVELESQGFVVGPGVMGENITTAGLDLFGLATATQLHIGPDAVVEVTGLRTPCEQLNGIQPGLMAAVLDRDADGNLIRKIGVMGVVLSGGTITAGDQITVVAPATASPLQPV
jgi:MOSC domain-containing protein YiiM